MRLLDRGQPLVNLAKKLDETIDGRRSSCSGRTTDKATDVVELIVHQSLLEHPRGNARDGLAGLARVFLGLAGEAPESSADLRWNREGGLTFDRLHQRLQRRVQRRQHAGDLDQAREVPVADDRDVADVLAPDAPVVLEIQPLDRLGEPRRRHQGAAAGRAQHPRLLVGQLRGARVDAWEEVLVVAILRVEAGYALGERLPALPLEDQQRLGTGLVGDGKLAQIRVRLPLQSTVHAVRQRVAADDRPHPGDQRVVSLDRRIDPAAVVERIEVHLQSLGSGVGSEQLLASRLVPAPDGLGIEMLGVVEHQVRLQGLVELVLAGGDVLTQVLLEIARQRGQERVLQHAPVRCPARGLEPAALIETKAHRPRHDAFKGGRCLREAGHTAECRQERGEVAARTRANRGHLLLDVAELAGHLGEITPVPRGAHPPGQGGEDQHDATRGDRARLEPLPATLPAKVEPREPGLLEHDLAQESGQKIAATARVLSGQEPALQAEAAREGAHHAIDGASFLGAAREVDTAEHELRFELRGGERGLDELHETIAQQGELLGEAVEQRAARRVALLLEALGQPIVQASLQPLELG